MKAVALNRLVGQSDSIIAAVSASARRAESVSLGSADREA
jgi:hypothetical protein